ncbi:hypothetical protein [Lacticaseibacillus camelliae]|uniref:hypothetical protein n=1 Tax=Lacticaseibacillus camelliae TaxID=381742 RepID=UPI0006D0D506|nr:hypothetical protein [Lacticaseibacillus camelliae]
MTGSKVEEEFGYLVKGFSIDAKVSDISKLQALDGVKSVEVSAIQTPQDISADKTVQAVQACKNRMLKARVWPLQSLTVESIRRTRISA